MRFLLVLVAALAFGACRKANEPFELETPSEADRDDYRSTTAHLLGGHVLGFGVVSRLPNGGAEHLGESLKWAGNALYSIPCAAGDALEAQVVDMIKRRGGQLVRVEPLGEYEGGREVSVDALPSLYLGAARRVLTCGKGDVWRDAWVDMTAWELTNDDRMHEAVAQRIPDALAYVRDLVGERLAVRHPGSRPDELDSGIAATAQGTKAAYVAWKGGVPGAKPLACYRVNLALETAQALELLGAPISAGARARFCDAAPELDIPTVDHYCGIKNLADAYLPSYEVDAWEYRHQRPATYETPHGNANTSLRLDKLMAYVQAYGFEELQR